MKILFLFDSLNRGGAEMWALDLCRNAKANDIDLVFVATGGGKLEEDFRNSGVEFIRLDRKHAIDIGLVRQLRKIIREHSIQVIHSNQPVDCLHAYLASRGLGVKHILSFHGHIPDAKNLLASRILFLLTDLNIVGTYAFEKMLAADLRIQPDERSRVVYYGVDEKRLDSTLNPVRDELGLADDAILFGMVANFYSAPRKDHMTVCRALPKLFEASPNSHFIFVFAGGQNEAQQKLEACVQFCESHGLSGQVHFAGDRFAAKDVIHALDVFVLSSLHESFGIAVVEAMFLDKPCILSDIDVLVEVSDSGKCASIFKCGDENDLAKKMIELASNADQRRQLGASGRQLAKKRYSIEVHLASLKQIYESLS